MSCASASGNGVKPEEPLELELSAVEVGGDWREGLPEENGRCVTSSVGGEMAPVRVASVTYPLRSGTFGFDCQEVDLGDVTPPSEFWRTAEFGLGMRTCRTRSGAPLSLCVSFREGFPYSSELMLSSFAWRRNSGGDDSGDTGSPFG